MWAHWDDSHGGITPEEATEIKAQNIKNKAAFTDIKNIQVDSDLSMDDIRGIVMALKKAAAKAAPAPAQNVVYVQTPAPQPAPAPVAPAPRPSTAYPLPTVAPQALPMQYRVPQPVAHGV